MSSPLEALRKLAKAFQRGELLTDQEHQSLRDAKLVRANGTSKPELTPIGYLVARSKNAKKLPRQ